MTSPSLPDALRTVSISVCLLLLVYLVVVSPHFEGHVWHLDHSRFGPTSSQLPLRFSLVGTHDLGAAQIAQRTNGSDTVHSLQPTSHSVAVGATQPTYHSGAVGHCAAADAVVNRSTGGDLEVVSRSVNSSVALFVSVACAWSNCSWIFTPLIETFREAFGAVGMPMVVCYAMQNCQLLEEVKNATLNNITPVIIGVASHVASPASRKCIVPAWERLAQMKNAYRILYNSEANPRWKRFILRYARAWQVHEVWDYSRHEMQDYVIHNPRFELYLRRATVRRFFPPGCARELDVGVDVLAKTRNNSVVGFMGAWFQRDNQTQAFYNQTLAGMLQIGSAWSKDEMRTYMERVPVQLSLHSRWNIGGKGALEPFRFAQLLTNRACVISELGSTLDMDEFKDMVHFSPAEGIPDLFLAMRDNQEAICTCQKLSYERYCGRFQPVQILQRSGFLDVLSTLGSTARLRRLHGTTYVEKIEADLETAQAA